MSVYIPVPGGLQCIYLAVLARGLQTLTTSLQHHPTSGFEVVFIYHYKERYFR